MRRALSLVVLLLLTGCGSVTAPVFDGAESALTASGTIQALEVQVASELGGRIQNIHVKLGDEVAAGDVLVELDATPWQLQLLPAEAAVETARAELALLEAGPRAEEIAAQRAAVALAKAERDGKLAAWENALALIESPHELDASIIEAKTQMALAEQGVELAEAQLERERMVGGIYGEGTMERKTANYQIKAAEAALAAAQADEATARTLWQYLWAIRNQPLGYLAQAHAAEGQYRVAVAGVEAAQAQLDDLLAGPSAAEIALAQAAVQQAEAEANQLHLKITRSTLTSPIDGVVVAKISQVGELAAPAATILTLADLSQVTLAVYVPENRIGHVSLGQMVEVQVDSFPTRVFTGTVSQIGQEPEFTPRNIATAEERVNTFYAVEIKLDNEELLLKPGMPADARFVER